MDDVPNLYLLASDLASTPMLPRQAKTVVAWRDKLFCLHPHGAPRVCVMSAICSGCRRVATCWWSLSLGSGGGVYAIDPHLL
jgi:hypothetical protein